MRHSASMSQMNGRESIKYFKNVDEKPQDLLLYSDISKIDQMLHVENYTSTQWYICKCFMCMIIRQSELTLQCMLIVMRETKPFIHALACA